PAQGNHTQGDQGQARVDAARWLCLRLRPVLRLTVRREDRGIGHGVAAGLGDIPLVVRRDRVAGGVFAGGGAGVGGRGGVADCQVVAVQIVGGRLLPVHVRQGQGAPTLLRGLGNEGDVCAGQVGIGTGGGDGAGGR